MSNMKCLGRYFGWVLPRLVLIGGIVLLFWVPLVLEGIDLVRGQRARLTWLAWMFPAYTGSVGMLTLISVARTRKGAFSRTVGRIALASLVVSIGIFVIVLVEHLARYEWNPEHMIAGGLYTVVYLVLWAETRVVNVQAGE